MAAAAAPQELRETEDGAGLLIAVAPCKVAVVRSLASIVRVTYFCFIASLILSVPHMEPPTDDDLDEARLEAEALLNQHSSRYAARVFGDDERVASIRRADRAAPERSTDRASV